MPKTMQVIESFEQRGQGIEGDPIRMVRQYHDFDGGFLAEEFDEWKKRKEIRLISDELRELFAKGEVIIKGNKIVCNEPIDYGSSPFLKTYMALSLKKNMPDIGGIC